MFQIWGADDAETARTIKTYRNFFLESGVQLTAEMKMGQWVMGHGSNGSPFSDGSRRSWVTASDPLTHDEITQYHYQATYFCFPLRLATI